MRATGLGSSCLLLFVIGAEARAQRIEYPPEEFAARRSKLCQAVVSGKILVFGATSSPPAGRFRQDNDFFYLTGNEDPSAALFIDASSCDAFLLLPILNESQLRVDGANWLADPAEAKRRGFAAIHPMAELEELLARRRHPGVETLHVRLSDRDTVDLSRNDVTLYTARRQAFSFGGVPTEDAWRVRLLRERYPYYELKDVSPLIDALRVIKSPREIEALRRNGRVSAEGVRRAIEATRPGRYEYELEAEAVHAYLKGGADGPGYAPIVGSGPNVNVWHYERNDRMMRGGELVVMDSGAAMGSLTMDITRTWPVSGRFDDLQLRAYQCVLEAEKAIVAALRPGATRAQTREIGRAIYRKWGFEDQRPPGAGHPVGMSVHDVGDLNAPFAPGMVIAVEPIIEIRDRQLHVRIEDTVLVTEGEPEVLTAGVPKEVDELLAIVGKAARGER